LGIWGHIAIQRKQTGIKEQVFQGVGGIVGKKWGIRVGDGGKTGKKKRNRTEVW